MRRNPLRALLDGLGIVGGILALSSLVQDWWEDLLQWKGFLALVIESYRGLVHPIYETLFSWVSLSPPAWFFDYFTFGLVAIGTFFRTAGRAMTLKSAREELEGNSLYNWLLEGRFGRIFLPAYAYMIARVGYTFLWPFIVVPALIFLPFVDAEERREGIQFLSWLLFNLIVLALLLSVNALL